MENQNIENRQNEIKVIKGYVRRCIYSTENSLFRIYAIVSEDGQEDNVIKGNIGVLDEDELYTFICNEEINEQYGLQYNVKTVVKDIPQNIEQIRVFLRNATSPRIADSILQAYPDILDRVLNNREIDIDKIPNVQYKRLERIKEKIITDFLVNKTTLELGLIEDTELVNKLVEKYDSVEEIKERLRTEPYRTLTNIKSYSFPKVDLLIQKYINYLETNKEIGIIFDSSVLKSVDRYVEFVKYIIYTKLNSTGSTLLPIVDLFSSKMLDTMKSLGINPKGVEEIIYKLDTSIIWIKGEESYLDCITTKKIYEKEKYIKETLYRVKEMESALKLSPKMQTYFDTEYLQDITPIDEVEESFSIGEGKYLNKNQRKLIEQVFRNKVVLLNGYAGTGKTATIRGLISNLEKQGYSYKLAAPTGIAARVMNYQTGKASTTIHKLLGAYLNEAGDTEVSQDTYIDTDVLIIDETTMVDLNLFYLLLEAIDFQRTNLLMIGDNAQLPSVGIGNVFSDLLDKSNIPRVELEEQMRIGKEVDAISKVAEEVRLQEYNITEKEFTRGLNEEYTFKSINLFNEVDMKKELLKLYKSYLDKGATVEDIMILTPFRSHKQAFNTNVINNLMQEHINSDEIFPIRDLQFKLNDKVMFTKNTRDIFSINEEVWDFIKNDNFTVETYNSLPVKKYITFIDNKDITYELKQDYVSNGESGIIVKDTGNGIVIRTNTQSGYTYYFVDDSEIKGDSSFLQLAYAVTIHKSQGSQARYTIVMTPEINSFLLNNSKMYTSNLFYVAITRTQEKCVHFGDIQSINKGSKIRDDLTRRTNLQTFLEA